MSSPKDMVKGFKIIGATVAIVVIAIVLMLFAPGAAYAGGGHGNGGGHTPITFCHVKSNPPQTQTTDENGWHGHKKHGDYLGECIAPEPDPEPVVEHVDESGCVSTTQFREYSWDVIDGVIHNVVDNTRMLTETEAVALGCYTVPIVDCGEWTVPGVLDEFGNPTSCVSNHPCPGLEAPACEEEVVPPIEEPQQPPASVESQPEDVLAHTGPNGLAPLIALAASLLIGSGLILKRRAHV